MEILCWIINLWKYISNCWWFWNYSETDFESVSFSSSVLSDFEGTFLILFIFFHNLLMDSLKASLIIIPNAILALFSSFLNHSGLKMGKKYNDKFLNEFGYFKDQKSTFWKKKFFLPIPQAHFRAVLFEKIPRKNLILSFEASDGSDILNNWNTPKPIRIRNVHNRKYLKSDMINFWHLKKPCKISKIC